MNWTLSARAIECWHNLLSGVSVVPLQRRLGHYALRIESRTERPADVVEVKRTDHAACPAGFLTQAYCVFSGTGATCEAAAAPVHGIVSGSAKNLATICGANREVDKRLTNLREPRKRKK
jgi:hypothetical protein